MKPLDLTIVLITGRPEPLLEWTVRSLEPQIQRGERLELIVVDSIFDDRDLPMPQSKLMAITHVPVKPNVWAGRHRLTKEAWWCVSEARNTGIALAWHPQLAFLDDRSVLMPGWVESIRQARIGGYAVCGRYQKRHNMKSDRGAIAIPGTISGEDHRSKGVRRPVDCPGHWWFGTPTSLPLEWALDVNGFYEDASSLGLEDCIFGMMLQRSGKPIKYDERMFIVEDRTPGPDITVPKRTDKGVSPQDKSHALLERVKDAKRAPHLTDLRALRASLSAGNPFPIPTEPKVDWYDGQPLSEF